MKEQLGEEKIKIYRRSWDIAPPELSEDSEFNPRNDIIYKGINEDAIPNTESLKDTYDRVIPYFNINIRPKILSGKNVIIAAHGNSLRALCKYLFKLDDKKISDLEIPTGNPLMVDFDKKKEIKNARYLDKNRAEKLIIFD